ncbi:MAG: hypothetical protein ABR540_21625 [Acidimicrobiales bacterium]
MEGAFGGKRGAIMEMRDISAYGHLGLNADLAHVDTLVDHLLQIYKMNKDWSE